MSVSEPREGRVGRRLRYAVGFQVVAVLIAAFVPAGFDHPSAFGLDFGSFLVLAALYAVALLYGIALAARLRRWGVLVFELALPSVFLALALTGVISV
jgi:hypothetical protein